MPTPYSKALILSGGGSRFGYYMGMYTALCELDKQPDIIIASCGGANIAGLISLCSDPKIAQNMLYSRTFYDMLCRLQPIKPYHDKHQFIKSASKRWLNFQKTKRTKNKLLIHSNQSLQALPNDLLNTLHKQALYQVAKESIDYPMWQTDKFLPTVLSNFSSKSQKKVTTIIVACRSVPFETGFVWQQILRVDDKMLAKQLYQLQKQSKLTATISHYSSHILPDLHIDTDMPLATAVRASINDMFYFPPISHQGHTLLGGVIDLLPIEIAYLLADKIYAERKTPYDKWTAEPAIHSVLGFYANDRRLDWYNFQTNHSQPDNSQSDSPDKQKAKNRQIHWIDTTNIRKSLPSVLTRKIKPLQGYIDLEYPSYETFVEIMEEQYEFGYKAVKQDLTNTHHEN